jgi:hypothetical protein
MKMITSPAQYALEKLLDFAHDHPPQIEWEPDSDMKNCYPVGTPLSYEGRTYQPPRSYQPVKNQPWVNVPPDYVDLPGDLARELSRSHHLAVAFGGTCDVGRAKDCLFFRSCQRPAHFKKRVHRSPVPGPGDDGKRFVGRADEILTAFSGTRIGDSRLRIFV